MSDQSNDQKKGEAPAQDTGKALEPYEFLGKFPNAPSKDQIEGWKAQTPGGRIRLKTSSDFKRVYIMRGIGGAELAQVQGRLPQNTDPERTVSELQHAIAVQCCLWTSVSADGKLTDLILRGSGAGLPQTLHEVVSILSDFEPPQLIEQLSVDL